MGAFLPFHVLYLKQSGITASELGVMLGITPLLAILSCMLLSAIADKYSALKLVTQIAIGGSALCFSLFIAVPVDQKIANAGSSLVNFTLNQSFELVQSSNSSSPIFEPVKNLSDGDAPIPALSFEVSGSLQFWLFFMLRLVGVLFFQPAFTLQTCKLQSEFFRGIHFLWLFSGLLNVGYAALLDSSCRSRTIEFYTSNSESVFILVQLNLRLFKLCFICLV